MCTKILLSKCLPLGNINFKMKLVYTYLLQIPSKPKQVRVS